MGRDKAGILLQGKRLLTRIKAEAAKTGWPVRVIKKDMVERCGPLGGIYTALKTSEAEAVLFLACDMPWVSAELLKRVAKLMTSKTDAVFTQQNNFVGFPFALRATSLACVEQQIGAGDFSLQLLARSLRAKCVRAKASELVDLDTPEDVADARRSLRRSKS